MALPKLLELSLVKVDCCPICEGVESIPLDKSKDTLTPEINRYLPVEVNAFDCALTNTRVKCVKCGLVYLSPRLDKKSLGHVYSYWYKYAYTNIFSDTDVLEQRKKEFKTYHLKYLAKYVKEPGRILDLGCGSGIFLSLAKDLGWNCVGVDFERNVIENGCKQFGLDLRCGTLDTVLDEHDTFDVAVMFDYLEHSPSPLQDIEALSKCISTNGYMVIRVPNVDGWQSKFMGAAWLGVICNHLSYFSPSTLSAAIEKQGYEIQYCNAPCFESQLDILRRRFSWLRQKFRALFVKNTTERQFAAVPLPDGGKANPIWRLLYSLFIEQLDHFGGWFGRGNNLLIVAKKVNKDVC